MEDFVHQAAAFISLCLGAIALVLIAFGAIEALIAIVGTVVNKDVSGARLREVFIKFARWLIAALTFQLGTDIVDTLVAPTWDDLGKLATVAVIRTFLTYFLDRDLDKYMERRMPPVEAGTHDRSLREQKY
ncbi:DUF1622 domain-containing protein [Noviherbaspirillum cavernae]|uniref:DUF1622 domain-containing protein n=1 Tax=Noviherbaspirillum cavernae TaxID=2320862 RepID=A0A418WUW4_9BURK|nr:DUF1622 domain-containing protein [Noviherbaspirillum cavernae]RJF96467.1 DUF1622 domain-containing protein [Noviherbaspirillum cavernae]